MVEFGHTVFSLTTNNLLCSAITISSKLLADCLANNKHLYNFPLLKTLIDKQNTSPTSKKSK